MRCPGCQAENLADSVFCDGCGARLDSACPACGADNRPTARYCRKCRASLATADPPPRDAGDLATAAARKVVTIVFADLVGSTSLHERMDAESARGLMDRYYRALRGAVEEHGGTVVKLLGDGVMAAFGVPRVGEDDAIRAVRAAVAMQRACASLDADGLALRVGVNTGEVVASEDHTDVVGDPVNVAARLQEAAHQGDVLIGEPTRRLVDRLVTLARVGDLPLKGRAEAVAAYRVLSLGGAAPNPSTAFVGRDDELRRLAAVYDDAVGAGRARLAVVLGSPGLGKSRLLDELVRRLADDATVVTAHCDAAGSTTFTPLVDALRALLGVDAATAGDDLRAAIDAALAGARVGDHAERARLAGGIAAFLGAAPPSPEESFFVVRRLLAALAATRPVVVAIDDLQWAEPLLLDLVEHLIQWTTDAPVFVVAAARPELRETRGALAARGALVADVVTLGGLDAASATRLAANVIGADALPAAVAGRVLATSEGNPLFVGELVRMLVHDGALKHEGGRWTAGVELAAVEMPPTIHAVLAARIERLRSDERMVLERAAVVGRQFSRAAVAHLLPGDTVDLDARLDALRRSELIEPDAGWFLGEPALRFHHVLVRDAAYRRLLKHTRAELHAHVADWLRSRVGDSIEHDETIGWHLEQAHRHLRELGSLDDAGRALGARASVHLAAAGRRALARDDVSVAASLLGRAIDCLDAADRARAELALDWCEALLSSGDVGPASAAIAELARLAGDSDRLRAWHTCFAGQLAVWTDPRALATTADAVAAAADALARAGDASGEAKAHSIHARALAHLGTIGASEAALDRALAAARRAHDRRRANAVLAGAPIAALWGPSPVTRASGRCLDVVRVLRIAQGEPAVEAVALRCQGVLEALRGRSEAAHRMLASSRRMVEELGITHRVLAADAFAGQVALLEGDAVAAERSLRPAYDGFRDLGLRIDAAQAAAMLGRALLAQGRPADAEAFSHASEALAGDDLKAGIAWRGVRAEALARRGEHETAVALARAAVDIAATTDALLDHADARLALAVALRAAGRHAEAAAEETRALELWDAKGATVLADRLRRGAEGARSSAHGGVRAGEATDAERSADAIARFDADGTDGTEATPRAPRIENVATRFAARFDGAWDARDWDRVAALFRPDYRLSDRRGIGKLDLDRDQFLAGLRPAFGMRRAAHGWQVLATRGERLALFRMRVDVSGGDVGPSQVEWLEVGETDDRGDRVAAVMFDADAVDAAYAELDARYVEGEGASGRHTPLAHAFRRAFAERDWDGLAAVLAPDLVVTDHRVLGWETLHGPRDYIQTIRSLVDLAPDVRLRIDHIQMTERGALYVPVWQGTHQGGAFETPSIIVAEADEDERIRRFDQYDMQQLDDARARLAAIGGPRLVSVPIPPNAATCAVDRLRRLAAASDWAALRDLLAPDFRYEDRRRLVGGSGGPDAFVARVRVALSAGVRATTEVLATMGDRLALDRLRFATFEGGALVTEVEALQVTETGPDGSIVATVAFDIDDRRAASREMFARYFASDMGRLTPPSQVEFVHALNDRDLARARAALPDDFYFHDHRRTGVGRLTSADDYVASMAAMYELSSDLTADTLYHVAVDEHGSLNVGRMFGRLRDGGEFESTFVRLNVYRDGRVVGTELFELEDLDAARARFEALRGRD